MSLNRLIFFPETPQQAVNNHSVVDCLNRLEFINSSPVDASKALQSYLIGNQFLSLLTFLGCSPNIKISPHEGEDYCRITLLPPSEQPRYLGHVRTANPKCPQCTRRIANWKQQNWQLADARCHCSACELDLSYSQLNWKHEGGFARGGFEVNPIFPHEAVPTEQLLQALQQCTNFNWQYAYANNETQGL